MKSKVLLISGVILLLVSIGFALYPTVSVKINQAESKNTVEQYDSTVKTLQAEEKNKYLMQAQKYNENLNNNVSDSFSPDAFNVDPAYEDILNFAPDGQIGTVDIPKINCELPIYHGTSEKMLEKGAVHMASTSFPIGGASTHSVISAHTAYPGKEFFDKLTELDVGDTFFVTVLGNKLTYRVCNIYTVLPTDTRLLNIENGKDYVTLVTCTPYAVNTHRLFVRGERVADSTPDETPEKGTKTNALDPSHLLLIVVTVVFVLKWILHRMDR